MQAYAGKVRTDIDHDAYKPAAWRVDSYLDASDDDQDIIASLRSHKLVFSKDTARNDNMARQEKLDDYSVSLNRSSLLSVMQQLLFVRCSHFASCVCVRMAL